MTRLAIVGAGPKAAALVARASELRAELGTHRVPELIVFERAKVGAAWDGTDEYSSGFVSLCTPGEKDVCFPYDDVWDGEGEFVSLASRLHARFSWSAYLVATGRYATWVDRGRDHPDHERFADYLDWVFDAADHDIVQGDVKRIWQLPTGKWCVEYERSGVMHPCVVDGVVLTGNGEPRPVDVEAGVPAKRVFDAASFWKHRETLLGRHGRTLVAVAGDGGSAGTIVAWLAQRFAERKGRIISISPMGTLFPRGDGHAERRWFTDPADWSKLTLDHRRKLIERTEAGVISMRNKSVIDGSGVIDYEAGYLRSVAVDADGQLTLSLDYDERPREPLSVDFVVNAVGFDAWTRLALVDHPKTTALSVTRTDANRVTLDALRKGVEWKIQGDLSLPTSEGFPPGIHVPSLAGLAQGPGIGNLGCLGLMARKILQPYLS
ncbi:SidA/IucD/PvdA family monooxygenase [Sphingomonas sp.]|jgi:mycobactin lysine-N-oxygenase|uniref:SidA/IucD/PvdA family monooxygenase n=1 Tax=Sphingomonas sp. TaxID=28214 RepID=UPI002E11321F|nr:SidA/IucD/PvdA family monooxygenase [Sphingomonas sp.]